MLKKKKANEYYEQIKFHYYYYYKSDQSFSPQTSGTNVDMELWLGLNY